jgi:serine/threonine-protein kinase
MAVGRTRPLTESTEDDRAFIQARLAVFWKAMFFILLFGSVLGVLGAVARPSVDVPLTMAATVDAGIVWWLCRRGERTIRFSRTAEAVGLLVISLISGGIGRYLLASFSSDRGLTTSEGLTTADGYVSMMQLAGMAMLMAIRAAIVPSRPLRTVGLTLMFGIPMILGATLLVPAPGGGIAWRPLDSLAYPWLPANAAIMWTFAIIASTVISSVIYGLRTEVREVRRLGQYVLERKLGQGGMGEVYRARHGMMRRPSAVKLMRADLAGEAHIHRFEREVQLTARLTHPNTITIFDYGRTDDGVFYYAMELLDGATLARIVAVDGPQPPGRVVRVLGMLCGALHEAHGIGLIHRDIKPANIMLCTQGGEFDVVKLLDFGLVKEVQVDGDMTVTGVNTVVGTPKYMAPESILPPHVADARADIYAVGAVAYFLLAGGDVFSGQSILEICTQQLHKAPEPLAARGVSVPPELEAIVMSCLSKDPNGRPQSAAELRRRVDGCGIEPWDSDRAAGWWRAHTRDFESDEAADSADGRTIAIDGAHRTTESEVRPA